MGIRRKPPIGNVRRVTSIGKNLRGVITNKTDRIVQFESFAERTLLFRLDRDQQVRDYASQPERFSWQAPGGKTHTYVPDFIVWRIDGTTEIHEVTRSERRTRDEIRRREGAAREICALRGWKYIIHTELTLPQEAEVATLMALYRFRPLCYAEANIEHAVRVLLENQQQMLLRSLIQRVSDELTIVEGRVTAAIFHLIWHDILTTNLQKLLVVNSMIVPDARVCLSSSR